MAQEPLARILTQPHICFNKSQPSRLKQKKLRLPFQEPGLLGLKLLSRAIG